MGTQSGKLLEVDLSSGKISTRQLNEKILHDYIGGSGLAARLFVEDAVPLTCDPLGPENILYILTGPLTGSGLPATPRFSVAAKSPLTGIWGEANSGGYFGPALKFAGWDGIVVRGQSKKPVMLVIEDQKVELKDASDLWGKDTYETADALAQRFEGKPAARMLSIGPAGENLVKFAAVCDGKHDYAGRTGLGAVMGSKKLKAIVVRGSGKLTAADPAAFAEVRKAVTEKVNEGMFTMALKAMGTNAGMVMGMNMGDVPTKNWSLGEDQACASELSSDVMNEKYLTKNSACYGCPIGCKRNVKVDEGPYKMEPGAGPEYETMASFGTMCQICNQAAVNKINELCNRLGVDTISCGCTIAFAIDCYEAGILTDKDTAGVKLTWGNADAVIEMIKKIAKREGLGNLLAEGSRAAGKKIGKNASDFAVEVKGLEAPMHDPRAFHGLGLAYAMSIRGACHLSHLDLFAEQGGVVLPEVGIEGGYMGQTSEGKAKLVWITENLASVLQSTGMCYFGAASVDFNDMAKMLNTAAGRNYTVEDLLKMGERIWLLKRSLNNLMGITIEDDRLPKKILTPTKEGGNAGSVPDIETMMKEYYEIRGLDLKGKPKKEKLAAVGLSDMAAKL
ncbi:MAG: aldehyde ferredoxin oxidoreductase [Candidatus Abyssobacteria bacterium SURF_17]|uniref:Aldehyde ferredoxin oxidoreductase n=1 Tax=Candidatus Abyssobacteria bacterium SURF_17 TaxID=2093361 RepID=A0A419F3Y7_9BACT|nr:MAG: aldehyde ferredoxin oxidoreductase [Candidatus Abyssubacteria bacterium SURF_17]